MKRVAAALALALQCGIACAQAPVNPAASDPAVRFVDSLPLYQPEEKVSGTITLWGHGSFRRDFMGKLVSLWIDKFVASSRT